MFTMHVLILAGAISITAQAGPWESREACESAARTTRTYAAIWVRSITTDCKEIAK